MRHQQPSALRTRREFIRQAACAAVGTAALSCAIRDLRFMNAAVAQSNITDYKALVCIFLAGGNDSNNLVIPTIQSEYDNYAAIRTPVLAIPLSGSPYNILKLDNEGAVDYTPLNSDGHEYGLHPASPELRTLFGEGKLAVLFNTGTLVFPMTRAEYKGGILQKPPQLFSHADQVTQWQTSVPNRPALTGWGGRCADLLASVQPNAPISLSVSLAGANTFEVGNIVSQYSVSTSGAIALSLPSSGATARQAALTNILGLPYGNLQAQAYAGVAKHSAANGGFGMKRQIFFCSVGGYDLHTNQTKLLSPGVFDTTQGSHTNLLAEISQCFFAFQRAMEQLGLSNNVTAFTASDFGRTFPSNGQGSDHGWGSHHLILGGAVNGRRTYGKFPTLTINGPDDTGTGRWIPTTACDQYFATLATWFGVDNNHLATVFPNLGNFSASSIGFI